MTSDSRPPRHYHWAGLDFLFDDNGAPVLIEANRSAHMLGEYIQFFGNDRPFALAAGVMNRAGGVPCLLWRSGDQFPDADEDACFIARHLRQHLEYEPVICDVEENQEPRTKLRSRDGRVIRPGSIFRWWYGLPWSYERAGVTVINPNNVWVTVRDKLRSYEILANARTFRVPRAFSVGSIEQVAPLLDAHPELFRNGYVLKPRVGWGGQGVQVADCGEKPQPFGEKYMLSERIIPLRPDGRYWEARVFVMAGVFLGGIRHSSRTPLTNYWRGGTPDRLDDATMGALEPAALEAVRLLDEAAEAIHRLPSEPASELTNVVY